MRQNHAQWYHVSGIRITLSPGQSKTTKIIENNKIQAHVETWIGKDIDLNRNNITTKQLPVCYTTTSTKTAKHSTNHHLTSAVTTAQREITLRDSLQKFITLHKARSVYLWRWCRMLVEIELLPWGWHQGGPSMPKNLQSNFVTFLAARRMNGKL